MGCGISSKPVFSAEPSDFQLNALVNIQLDKWNLREIMLVRSRFKRGLTRPKQWALDRAGFHLVFPGLDHLHELVSLNAFHIFDQDASRDVNFKEFCYVLTTLVYGTVEEQKDFVFRLFDQDRDGVIAMKDLKLALMSFMMITGKKRQAELTDEILKEVAANADKILKNKKALGEEEFVGRMEEFVPLSSILEIFEIIPSPITEFKIINAISVRARQDRSQTTCRVISYKWWSMWYSFIKLHNEIESSPIRSTSKEDLWFFHADHCPARRKSSFSPGVKDADAETERPGEIDNGELEGPIKGTLKDGLIYMRDYVAIPNEAWECFCEWYGGGPEFERAVLKTPEGKFSIELYPPVVYITTNKGETTPTNSYIPFIASKTTTMKELLKLAKNKFGKKGLDCRLWYRYMVLNSKWKLALNPNETLEELRIGHGDKLILESRTINGWPRDRLRKDGSQWEEGDKVDIYMEEAKEWKEGVIVRDLATNFQVKVEDRKVIPVEKNATIIAPYRTHTTHSFQSMLTPDIKLKLVTEFKPLANLGNT